MAWLSFQKYVFRYDATPFIINCLLSDSTGTGLQQNEMVRSIADIRTGTGNWDIFELRAGSTAGNCGNFPDTGRAGNGENDFIFSQLHLFI